MATHDLKVALNNFIKQVEAKRSTNDPIRNILNQRTQAYIVNPRVIFKEVLRPESPYRIQLDRGIITKQELRGIAREISSDYWRELKMTATKYKIYVVKGDKLPSEFINSEDLVVGLDERKRIIYWRGKSGDFYESFRAGIVKPTIDRIKGRTDVMNPLRVYVSPDAKYIAELNIIDQEVNSILEAEGLPTTGGPAQNRRGRARKKYIKENNLPEKPWQGIDIGHVFGAKATGAAGLLSSPHDVAHNLKNITLGANLGELEPELQEIVEYVINTDIEAVWERIFRNDTVAGKLTLLIPESYVNNRFTGGTTGQRAQKALNAVVKDLGQNLGKLKGSPSYEDLMETFIEQHFLDKRKSNKRYKTKASTKRSTKGKVPIRGIPSARVKIKAKEASNSSSVGIDSNVQSLIRRLNERLHDKIRENMGKGGSKKVLNYRTGRFARSAKIQSLYPVSEKNAIGAQVRYMRDPYKVFEPGGSRLATPGRNPSRIFGISIRQLLQEEKLASLRRVKVTLRG